MVAPRIGFLFPGQGAQYVGMGKEVAAQSKTVRKIFDEGDRTLGFSISQNCFKGPDETLTRTVIAQPAIFVTSLALLSLLQEKLPELKPAFVAGLSLGEFSALVAAGALDFVDGLRLVQIRAQLMEQAAAAQPGTMVSILGLAQEDCEAIAKESGAELANLNTPDQFVLSGTEPAIAKAAQAAEARGAKRVIRLKVNGAFHSTLMELARNQFCQALRNVSIRTPQSLFVPNVTARAESDPETIRQLLGEQLTSPVRWFETMQYAKNQGIQWFIELGPGRVLKGLARRIDPSFEVFSFEKFPDLVLLESALAKV